jgi:MoaA/NifB/PqqE/SkfB family radical SAM enzyme
VKLLRNPRFLKLFNRRLRDRLDPREKKEVVVDICGACNLRCPSCPVGGIGYKDSTLGLMDVDLFRKLIAKADDEFRIKGVNLFNWGEPMLNPHSRS